MLTLCNVMLLPILTLSLSSNLLMMAYCHNMDNNHKINNHLQLVWSDEFNGPTVNTDKWDIYNNFDPIDDHCEGRFENQL